MAVADTLLTRCIAITLVSVTAGCAIAPADQEAARQNVPPNVMPARQAASGTLRLDNSRIAPMYRGVLTVDLESVERVAESR